MNKTNWKLLLILFISELVFGQNFMIFSPEHLAINNSTARISSDLFSNSGMAQSYYLNSTSIGLSLYLPYSQLTDSRIYTSAMNFYLPTYNWGTLKLSYTNNNSENFDKLVYSNKMMQIGYAKNISQRLIVSTMLKWNRCTWYSDIYPEFSTNGYSTDFNSIFIIDGYSAMGISLENIYRSEYSSIKNDGEPRNLRLAYNRINESEILSWETGCIFNEDTQFNYQMGGFFNSVLKLPYTIYIGAEYKYLNYHELGTFIGFIFQSNSFLARISYAMRFDNSPLPISTYRHALGIQFTLNRSQKSKTNINPQILMRDDIPPYIMVKNISDCSVLKCNDESDILKLVVNANDEQSGLAKVKMTIVPSSDTTQIVYEKKIIVDNRSLVSDTLYFNGKISENDFLNNGKYLLRFLTTDLVGNSAESSIIPFQILAHQNDDQGPEIAIDFDTTTVNLGSDVENYSISTKVSISDNPGTPLTWQIALYRSNNDSTWIRVKTSRGNQNIQNQKFQWSLGINSGISIRGSYKTYVEAYDVFSNKTVKWSTIKRIFQEIIEPQQEDTIQIEKSSALFAKIDTNKLLENKKKYKISTDSTFNRYYVKATYSYRGKIIEMSDFIFEYNKPFSTFLNRNGLHIIGVYLQDLPNSNLIVQSTNDILNVAGSKTNLITFLSETYNISKDRIKFIKIEGKNKLHFLMKE